MSPSGERWGLLALGAAVFAIVALWKRSTTDALIESAEIVVDEIKNAVVSPSMKVINFAQAIARAEGFYVTGSLPQRINNPGDLKVPGTPPERQTSGGLTMYDSVDQGWAALYRQLNLIASGRSLYKLDWTLRQMGSTWAPSADRNVPGAWAANVAASLGVSVDTTLRELLT